LLKSFNLENCHSEDEKPVILPEAANGSLIGGLEGEANDSPNEIGENLPYLFPESLETILD